MASLQMRVAGRSFRVARKFMHPLGEQLGAGLSEFHIGAALVHPEPASLDRQLHAGAVFGWRTAVIVGKLNPASK